MRFMGFRRAAVAATAVVALAAAACGNSAGAGAPAPTASPAINAAQAELLPTNVYALPSFDLTTYRQLLGQLNGTPVVVNIWASWCGPCRVEAPHLAAAAAKYGRRVQFLGVDILDARAPARQFMHEFGWTYPSVFDASGAIRDGLGLLGQPDTLFYDASGTLVSTWSGLLTAGVLQSRIDRLLGGGASGG